MWEQWHDSDQATAPAEGCQIVRVVIDNYVLIGNSYLSSHSNNKNMLTGKKYPQVQVIKGYKAIFLQQALLKDFMYAYFIFCDCYLNFENSSLHLNL